MQRRCVANPRDSIVIVLADITGSGVSQGCARRQPGKKGLFLVALCSQNRCWAQSLKNEGSGSRILYLTYDFLTAKKKKSDVTADVTSIVRYEPTRLMG